MGREEGALVTAAVTAQLLAGSSPTRITPPPPTVAQATQFGRCLAHPPAVLCWAQRGRVFSPWGRAVFGLHFCNPSLPVAQTPPALVPSQAWQ